MNPVTTGSRALRRAALQLHSLNAADRDWMLATLSPVRRARLEVLLAELRSLGIPPDAHLPMSCDVARTHERDVPCPDAPIERLQHISGADLDWLVARLQEEPPQVAALLVSARNWEWRDALISRLDVPQAACVAPLAGSPAAPLAQAAMLEALARMLPVRSSNRSSPPKARWWRRWA